MYYYKEKTLEEMVNQRGSKLWIMMNDNSKASRNRAEFIANNGGFFTQHKTGWVWTTPVTEKNGYWLKRVDTGEKTFFENMSEFAKKNGMTAVKVCELLNGKRKTYKGWTAVEIREVKDSVGSFEKEKEPEKPKVMVTKQYTLIDTTTNQLLHIDNLSQFAKKTNLDYGNLKKLVNGKVKTYKNLKVYDPLAQYKVSPEPK